MKHNQPIRHSRHRQGTVLLLVLVVAMMLSLSLYAFSESMLVSYEATQASLTQLQTRQLADSGIAAAMDYVGDRQARRLENATNNPHRFRHVELTRVGGEAARYSVMPSFQFTGDAPTFGLGNESARLNLNALPLANEVRPLVRARLTKLPGVTDHIADAILDWMDADDELSEFGAESSYYTSLHPPYRPRQRRFESLQELLLVRGVTAELLFGEDTNHNGLLDPNENDGHRSDPPDNADGKLQSGWSDWLTVHAAESTLREDGTRKINVNTMKLAELFDQLEAEFDADVAKYVVAYRMAGRVQESKRAEAQDEDAKYKDRIATSKRRLADQLGTTERDTGLAALAESESRRTEQRGGMLLKPNPIHEIRSLIDLIGGRVRISIDGTDTLLDSPWKEDADGISKAMATLESRVALTSEERLIGRINIGQAPLEVLLTVPGMNESMARAIVNNRPRHNSSIEAIGPRNVSWLLRSNVLKLEQLRTIAPYITTGGDVFNGVSIGHIDNRRSRCAVRFLIDATGRHPKLLGMHDLPPMPFIVGDTGNTRDATRSKRRRENTGTNRTQVRGK